MIQAVEVLLDLLGLLVLREQLVQKVILVLLALLVQLDLRVVLVYKAYRVLRVKKGVEVQ